MRSATTATCVLSVVALTTTGFGNAVPITAVGTVVTSVGLIAAVTLVPWLVVRAGTTGEVDVRCPRCEHTEHHAGANYRWRCEEAL